MTVSKNKNYRWQHHRICRSVSLCTPAVRTFMVTAWACRDRDTNEWICGSDVIPVLCLETRSIAHYVRHVPVTHCAPVYGTPELLEENGWDLSDEEVECGFQFIDPEFHVPVSSFDNDGGTNTEFEVVACSWEESDDEKKLKEIADRLMESVLQSEKQ